MNRDNEHAEQERQAAALDHLADVPTGVLVHVVERDGACWWAITSCDPPAVVDEEGTPDRALAAFLCADCPVPPECLELELRTAGAATVGVWGALDEDDRRALHPVWRARRELQDDESNGGDRS